MYLQIFGVFVIDCQQRTVFILRSNDGLVIKICNPAWEHSDLEVGPEKAGYGVTTKGESR